MERVAADPRRISDPVFLNAAKRLQQLVKIGAFQKGFLLSDWPQAEADFKAERSAMQFAVTWSLGPYLKDPAVEKFLDYLPYPKVDESLDLSKTFALQYDPMLGFSISSKTKDVKATVDYLKFLVEENALFYVQELKSPVLFDPGKKIEGMHPLMERYFQAISKPDYAYQWIAFQLNADGIGNVIMSSQKLMALDTTPEEFVEILGQALQ
jgi:raffinose/stachyose/melibiose transport system substrate-binding protein